jgi:hypothetical protein
MQYKTIVLQLLELQPELYDQLRRQRRMLPTLEYHARELKTLHEAWKEILAQATPASDPSQIASEALELALKDLVDRLPIGSAQDGQEALSLEEAMAFIRRHTPHG